MTLLCQVLVYLRHISNTCAVYYGLGKCICIIHAIFHPCEGRFHRDGHFLYHNFEVYQGKILFLSFHLSCLRFFAHALYMSFSRSTSQYWTRRTVNLYSAATGKIDRSSPTIPNHVWKLLTQPHTNDRITIFPPTLLRGDNYSALQNLNETLNICLFWYFMHRYGMAAFGFLSKLHLQDTVYFHLLREWITKNLFLREWAAANVNSARIIKV